MPSVSDTVVDFLRDSPYLVSSRPEFSQHSFWVQELDRRETTVVKWQERGEDEEVQITGGHHQTMVTQLLLMTGTKLSLSLSLGGI